MGSARHLTWLIAAALPLLLPGCGEAPKQEPDPIATALNKRFESKFDAGPIIDNLNVHDTVQHLVDGNSEKIDLSLLGTYAQKLTKSDFMPLADKRAGRIKILLLSKLELGDAEIEPISHLNLRCLTLDDTNVKDLHALENMKSLEYLSLKGTRVNHDGIRVIKGLPGLTFIDLTDTPIDGNDLLALKTLKKLLDLRIASCPGIKASHIAAFQKALPSCVVGADRTQDTANSSLDVRKIVNAYGTLGNFEATDESFERLISDWVRQKQPRTDWLADAYFQRALINNMEHHESEALQYFAKALPLLKKSCPDSTNIATAEASTAATLEKQRRWHEALVYRGDAARFFQTHPATGLPEAVQADNVLHKADDFMNMKNPAAAIETCTAAWSQFKDPAARANLHDMAGQAYYAQKKYDEALQNYTEAEKLFKSMRSPMDSPVAIEKIRKARVYVGKKEPQRAETLLKEALSLNIGTNERQLTIKELTELLKSEGKLAEARQYAAKR